MATPSIQQYLAGLIQPTAAPYATAPSGTQNVQESLDAFLNPNSDYIRNARQRGLEFAATRGGINSSIAAGAAERSAMEAATPLAQQALAIDAQREATLNEDWLSQQNFARSMQGQLALAPLQSSLGMMEMVSQYALQDPALYTPEVTSGYTNFFNQNMNNMLQNYFKDLGLGTNA